VTADVSISQCEVAPGDTSHVIVNGSIVNHDSQTDDYTIVVSIQDGSGRVGEAFEADDDVAAGETATWSAEGLLTGRPQSPPSCTLTWLHRTASD
jgi:hypothetical protein